MSSSITCRTKTKAVRAWQAAHPHVHFHFTPTYSSWLNQVELWFAKIERDLIARGIFTSASDLRKKLRQYITLHNKTAQPFEWIYDHYEGVRLLSVVSDRTLYESGFSRHVQFGGPGNSSATPPGSRASARSTGRTPSSHGES